MNAQKIIQGKDGYRIAVLEGDSHICSAIERDGILHDVSGSVQQCPASNASLAIDVGAFIGDTAVSILALGYKSVIAYEPLEDAFGCLLFNIAERNLPVRPFRACVGNGETLDFGAFDKSSEPGTNYGARWATENMEGDYIAVRIDDLMLPRTERVGLLKIDVEGREPEVIEGARHTIGLHRPHLHVEVNRETLERRGSSIPLLLGLIHDLGYRTSICTHRIDDGLYDQLFFGDML